MTAGYGLVHEEMHSWDYTKSGGPFEAIQLWVNLPARLKMTPPKYQTLTAGQNPGGAPARGAGPGRLLPGGLGGRQGPAAALTPIELFLVPVKARGRAAPPV